MEERMAYNYLPFRIIGCIVLAVGNIYLDKLQWTSIISDLIT